MRVERMPGYAFTRLAWRPAALIAAPVLIGFLMFPIYGLPDNIGPWLGPVSQRISEEKIRFFLWQTAIGLPGFSAFVLGLATHEARQSAISWMLPRYRIRLLPPAMLLCAPFILLPAVSAGRALSWSLAPGMLGVGVLSFGFAWRITDRTVPDRWNAVAIVSLLALTFQPQIVDNLFSSQPILFAALSASAGIAWWLPQLSAQTNRKMAVKAADVRGASLFGYFERLFRPWQSPRTLPGRLSAGLYESPFGGFGYFGGLTLEALWIGALGVAVGFTGMVATLLMFSGVIKGIQLKDVFAYPMSRRERANTFFAANLFDSSIGALFGVATVLLISSLGLWRDEVNQQGPGKSLILLLFLFLLAPIAQSVQASRNVTPTRKNRVSATAWMISVAVIIPWHGMAAAGVKIFAASIVSAPALLTLIAVLASFVIIQTIYLLALRWYFSRRDFSS